jgi:hypothetical protein
VSVSTEKRAARVHRADNPGGPKSLGYGQKPGPKKTAKIAKISLLKPKRRAKYGLFHKATGEFRSGWPISIDKP